MFAVAWNDGQTDNGTLVSIGNGVFTVTDSRTFYASGSMYATVTVNDSGGASNNASTYGWVADAPFSVSGSSITVDENNTYTGSVGSLSDQDPNSSAGNFSATLDLNGQSYAVAVDGWGGSYSLDVANIGAFTLADNGASGTLTVTKSGGASQTANVPLTVNDAGLSASGSDFVTTPNAGETETVASFSDSDPISHGAGAYSATIDWGDGNQSTGTIVDNGDGSYSVQGTHSYSAAGSYSVSTAVYDNSESGSSAQAFAGSTGTVVQVNSITASDGASSGNSVTATDTSSGNTLYFTTNEDGSGSIAVSGSVVPNTAAAYAATQYMVVGADGTLVGSGPLSAGAQSVNLPSPPDGVDDSYTIEAGTIVNGVFNVTQTLPVATTTIKLAANGPGNKSTSKADSNGIALVYVSATDDNGDFDLSGYDLTVTGVAGITLKEQTAQAGGKQELKVDASAVAAGSYTITIGIRNPQGHKVTTTTITIVK